MTSIVVKESHEADRIYEIDGKDYPSVTSVIRYGVGKPGLMTWTADQVLDIAIRERVHLATLDDKQARAYLSRQAESVKLESAGKGNLVHQAAESYALGNLLDLKPDEEELVLPYMRSFDNFLYDWKPVYLLTEALVVSEKYGYAGTLDAAVEIEAKRGLLDIKSGSRVWNEVSLQLAAYANADYVYDRVSGEKAELPDVSKKRALVLHLRPDEYKLRPVRIDTPVFNAFLAALDLYHFSVDESHGVVMPELRKDG
jgi:hypothetical protein